jgi:hypothetical protein
MVTPKDSVSGAKAAQAAGLSLQRHFRIFQHPRQPRKDFVCAVGREVVAARHQAVARQHGVIAPSRAGLPFQEPPAQILRSPRLPQDDKEGSAV